MTQVPGSATVPACPAQWLRTGQASRELGISETRIRQLGDEGVIEMQRTALGRLFSHASVLRYKTAAPRKRGRPARRPTTKS